jgi:hypothetical protein
VDDLIGDLELQEVVGRGFSAFRRERALGPVPPQDRGAALGGYDGVGRVLEHEKPVTDAYAQRPSAAASPMTMEMVGTPRENMK